MNSASIEGYHAYKLKMDNKKYIDIYIIGFIFLILFVMPIIFVRINDQISWRHVIKIWQDYALLIPIYVINHWILLPHLLKKRKYSFYIVSIICIIVLATCLYKNIDSPLKRYGNSIFNQPTPIPPYANMMSYAILIVGIDIGLFFSKQWHNNEKRTIDLERRNTMMELELLRNQISPHFFMNTLNNIFSLIDSNTTVAKTSVIKLSKMMRYLLYENNNGLVKLSKEFEFIRCYIDLMRLRYTDDVIFTVTLSQTDEEILIPPMLFISYIENAVKHGVSYQENCEIKIVIQIIGKELYFTCSNPIHRKSESFQKGGIGLKNSESRLKLIYGDKYNLSITETENVYNVSLIIPII